MGNHHGLRLFTQRSFQLRNVNIVLGYGHVHEDRHSAILKNGRNGGGKRAGHGDNLIARLDSALSQFRRSEGHKRNQIGGGSAVDQTGEANAKPFSKFLFKCIGKTPCGQPEIKGGIRQRTHFLFIKNA